VWTLRFAATCSSAHAGQPRPKTIDAKVDDGFVTLTGTARQYQRDEAELVASSIVGALEVIDNIELEYPTSSPATCRSRSRRRSSGMPRRCGRPVRLDDNGTVTLDGNVGSWAEHDEAIEALGRHRASRRSTTG